MTAWETVSSMSSAPASRSLGPPQAQTWRLGSAARSRRVRVVHEVPADEGPEVTYAVCALEGSGAGRAFVEFLATPAARQVFEAHGFGVLEEGGR